MVDQVAAVGNSIEDEDLISFIVSSLNPSFNTFITSFQFATYENPLTLTNFEDELLSPEMLLNNQSAIDAIANVLVAQKPTHLSFPQNFKHKPHHPMKFSPQPHNSKPLINRPLHLLA